MGASRAALEFAGFSTNRSQSAALILQQKLCGRSHPVISHITGIGFERYYPYLVLFLTFHRDWRVSEHDAYSSYRSLWDLFLSDLTLATEISVAWCVAT